MELQYDLEWLTILRLTNHLLSVRYSICHMPGKESEERFADYFRRNIVM